VGEIFDGFARYILSIDELRLEAVRINIDKKNLKATKISIESAA
jgi:hypothetical protein